MKKIGVFLLAAWLLLNAASCSQAETESGKETGSAPVGTEAVQAGQTLSSGAAVADDGYVCTLDSGASIRLGMKAEEILDSLGTVTDLLEAPSCLYDGTDKIYTIDGAYTVTVTQSADGAERITELSFLNDAAALQTENALIMIGSSEEELTAAFGSPSESAFGILKFPLAGGLLTAAVTDGTVTGLTVSYAGK